MTLLRLGSRWIMCAAAVLVIAHTFCAPIARDVTIIQADGTVQHGQKWALVIGCNGYDPREVGALKVAVADAKRIRDFLVSKAGFDPDQVLLLTDEGLVSGTTTRADRKPTYTTLRGQIAKFTQAHRDSDVLVLFFAGHGFYSQQTSKDYLAPLDVQRADLEHTGIPVEDVLGQLRNSGARQAVLIVDACRSPGLGGWRLYVLSDRGAGRARRWSRGRQTGRVHNRARSAGVRNYQGGSLVAGTGSAGADSVSQ